MMPSAQQAAALLCSTAAVLAAVLLGYDAVRLARLAREERGKAEEERKANVRNRTGGMQHHKVLRELIYNSTGRGFAVVKRVYVVPGGGPGSVEDGGYPPWTAQRVEKALQRYEPRYAETTAFLALGAGSMNAPSPRAGNGHVVFESTRIAEELARGGVPPGSIIVDFVSWDTVGNAWFARMAVEALLDMSFRSGDTPDELHAIRPAPASARPASSPSPIRLPYAGSGFRGGGGGENAGDKIASPETKKATPTRCGLDESLTDEDDVVRKDDESKGEVARGLSGEEKTATMLPAARAGEAYEGGEIRQWMFKYKAKRAKARRGPLNVTVFVSDFHAERMDTIFQWVFGLEPSLLDSGKTTLTTVSIDTPVEMWARGPEQRQARVGHERAATEHARLRALEIRTVEEMRAFMILGAHKGYFNLTHGKYTASAGGGWGGA